MTATDNFDEIARFDTMKFIQRTAALALSLLILSTQFAIAEEKTVADFDGTDDSGNLTFSVVGAWELRWQVEGDKSFPALSHFDVHLHNAATGRFLGVVAQATGSGSGTRRMADGGRFNFRVSGSDVRWRLEVVDLEEPWATISEFEDAEEVSRTRVIILEDLDANDEALSNGAQDEDQ